MASLHLQIVTPERIVVQGEFRAATIPTRQGQITVLPDHTPLVTLLAPGELILRAGGVEEYFHVNGGVLTVERRGKLTILADAAEHIDEIDEARADAARERAAKMLKEEKLSAEEFAATEAALARSISRLHLVRRRKSRH